MADLKIAVCTWIIGQLMRLSMWAILKFPDHEQEDLLVEFLTRAGCSVNDITPVVLKLKEVHAARRKRLS